MLHAFPAGPEESDHRPTCPECAALCVQATHRCIRLLGRGIAADTWLFSDRTRGELVAIKLFTRPVNKAQLASITQEILVSPGLVATRGGRDAITRLDCRLH